MVGYMNCLHNFSKLMTMMNQLKDLLGKIDRLSILKLYGLINYAVYYLVISKLVCSY